MGRALAVLMWLITLFAVVLFSGKHGWFPETISEHGPAIDAQFMRTLVVVAIAFVLRKWRWASMSGATATRGRVRSSTRTETPRWRSG